MCSFFEKGNLVAIKRLPQKRIELTREILLELKVVCILYFLSHLIYCINIIYCLHNYLFFTVKVSSVPFFLLILRVENKI